MTNENLNYGDQCPQCKNGYMEVKLPDECSCHICPPCGACIEAPLFCTKCKYTAGENE